MGRLISTLAGIVVVVAGVVGLAFMDQELFPDAEESPLYESTLRSAYSRFESQDQRVPARPPSDVQAASRATPAANAPLPAGTAEQLRLLQAAQQASFPEEQQYSAEMLERLRQASVAQALQGSGVAGPGVAPGHEGHQHGPVAVGSGMPGVAPGHEGHQHGPAATGEASHDHTNAFLAAGEEFFAQQLYEEALTRFRSADQDLPDCTQVHHRMGDVLVLLERPDEAVAEYDRVLAADPGSTCAYTHIGDILISQGRVDEAEAPLARAEEGYRLQLLEGGARATSARYHLAKLFVDHDRQLDEALAFAEQAVADDPDQAVFVQLLSRCHRAHGDEAQAQAWADRAAELAAEHTHPAHAHSPAPGDPDGAP